MSVAVLFPEVHGFNLGAKECETRTEEMTAACVGDVTG